MSDLLGNPEDRFSRNEAQLLPQFYSFQLLPTLKDGKFVQEITPQLPNGGKAHYVKTFAKGDVLTGVG